MFILQKQELPYLKTLSTLFYLLITSTELPKLINILDYFQTLRKMCVSLS